MATYDGYMLCLLDEFGIFTDDSVYCSEAAARADIAARGLNIIGCRPWESAYLGETILIMYAVDVPTTNDPD